MIRKHLGEQGVEPLVCEHAAKGSKGATNPQHSRHGAHVPAPAFIPQGSVLSATGRSAPRYQSISYARCLALEMS
jgi:hypothetical protein